MNTRLFLAVLASALCLRGRAILAAAPPAPAELSDWSMPFDGETPGAMAADALLPAPAGKSGPVIARDGHFYSGDRRVRFWGVNIAFAGNFPTHDQADAVARRLARFGINAVRLHHMDSQPFPNGIFADRLGEKLSPEAMDRLDYFIAALKKNGVYSDVNLHVSRNWSRSHHWPAADQLPEYDKVVDIFHPDLIAAQKQFARDLLTHVNAYTNLRYADDPGVAIVEITNEDTIFLWGGEGLLAKLPDPYAGMLQQQWNAWLNKKYGAREKLKASWAVGEEPLGEDLLVDPLFSSWAVEQHEGTKMERSPIGDQSSPDFTLNVKAVDGTDWHLQFNRPKLKLEKGKFYTVRFRAKAEPPTEITLSAQQAHQPWGTLGLSRKISLDGHPKDFRIGFTAGADDDNVRLSFSVGHAVSTLTLWPVEFLPGGREGLRADEDPAQSTIARGGLGGPDAPARSADWYDFLQQTDERYFVEMQRFLKEDIGVKCVVTGSIGLGPLGTLSQSHMDFVDGHAYWDHPSFPHRQWDMRDWLIKNQPMVDDPAGSTLWNLATTRVVGKPYTVTEYNHAAPNEWQAECLPIIATYAATQDWDGVFLFAYSHNSHYDKGKTDSFFDIEGNPLKMNLSPAAARIFLGQAVEPSAAASDILANHDQMLRTGSQYYFTMWPWVRDGGVPWQQALGHRIGIDFSFQPRAVVPHASVPGDERVEWTSAGPSSHTGRFTLKDKHAAVFVGFAGDSLIDLNALRIEKLQTPFATLMLVPADGTQAIDTADRLLLTAVGRGDNAGMQWDAQRRTISDHWGAAPPRIEAVRGTLSIAGKYHVFTLTPEGKRDREIKVDSQTEAGRTKFEIGTLKTMWFELVK